MGDFECQHGSKECVGNLLEVCVMANRTESLSPAHNYVPWIVVDGVHTDQVEKRAMADLAGLGGELYKGTKPVQCKTLDTVSNIFIEKVWREDKGEQESKVDSEVDDNTCVLCKYVISTLDGLLEHKTNEKEIEEALESLCSFLPSTMMKQCDSFVDTYTNLIIDLLTKDVSPEMVCGNLGLCPDQTLIGGPFVGF